MKLIDTGWFLIGAILGYIVVIPIFLLVGSCAILSFIVSAYFRKPIDKIFLNEWHLINTNKWLSKYGIPEISLHKNSEFIANNLSFGESVLLWIGVALGSILTMPDLLMVGGYFVLGFISVIFFRKPINKIRFFFLRTENLYPLIRHSSSFRLIILPDQIFLIVTSSIWSSTYSIILSLTVLIWLRKSINFLSSALIPEEMRAELIALKQRREKQKTPCWKLYFELTTEVLLLLAAIHIQIRIENLWLAPGKKRNID
jgi:hypothetical protein